MSKSRNIASNIFRCDNKENVAETIIIEILLQKVPEMKHKNLHI